MNVSSAHSLRLVVTATLIAGFPLASGAQSRQPGGFGGGGGPLGSNRPVRVLIGGGLTVPTGGEFKATHENGFHVDGAVILRIPGLPLAVRPQLSYASFQFKRQPNNGPITQPRETELSTTKLLTALGNLELPFGRGFYVMAGAGATNLNTNFSGDTLSNAKATNLILDVGAGYRFEFGAIQGFVEARTGSASFDKEKIGYSRTQFVPMTFGFVF